MQVGVADGQSPLVTHSTHSPRLRAQMGALFPEQHDAILNSRRIAEMTDLTLPLGQLRIPHFPVPDGETPFSYLTDRCWAGARRRYHPLTSAVVKRPVRYPLR